MALAAAAATSAGQGDRGGGRELLLGFDDVQGEGGESSGRGREGEGERNGGEGEGELELPGSARLQLPFQQWMSQHAARLLLPHSMRHMVGYL
jgi:hypothetical protein